MSTKRQYSARKPTNQASGRRDDSDNDDDDKEEDEVPDEPAAVAVKMGAGLVRAVILVVFDSAVFLMLLAATVNIDGVFVVIVRCNSSMSLVSFDSCRSISANRAATSDKDEAGADANDTDDDDIDADEMAISNLTCFQSLSTTSHQLRDKEGAAPDGWNREADGDDAEPITAGGDNEDGPPAEAGCPK